MQRMPALLMLSMLVAAGSAAAVPAATRSGSLSEAPCAAPPTDSDGDGVFDAEEDVNLNGDCDDDDDLPKAYSRS